MAPRSATERVAGVGSRRSTRQATLTIEKTQSSSSAVVPDRAVITVVSAS